MGRGLDCLSPPYQIVHLVVPPTGHKHHFSSLLCDFQRRAAVLEHRVLACVQEFRGSHIVGQATMAVPQRLLLPRWEEEPLLPPTDVGRPAVGAEDVRVEW